MPNPRSDADQLARSPIKVTLGERVYDVPTLRVKAAHDWRKQLVEALAPIVAAFDTAFDPSKAGTPTPTLISDGLLAAFVNFPEVVIELVFSYAGESLKREEIEAEATDEQVAAAFAAILNVAYPFLPSLKMAKTAASASPRIPPATAKSTN